MLTYLVLNINLRRDTMKGRMLSDAIEKLSEDFPHLHWDFRPEPVSGNTEIISQWLGEPDEEVMVCAFKGITSRNGFTGRTSSLSILPTTVITKPFLPSMTTRFP